MTWNLTLEDLEPQIPLCLDFLVDNAKEIGRLRGLSKGLESKRKIIRAEEFLKAEGKTIAEREAMAECSVPYQRIVEEQQNAEADFLTLKTLMSVRELKVEVFRSLNARAKKGHL
jgi:hypothetical protein